MQMSNLIKVNRHQGRSIAILALVSKLLLVLLVVEELLVSNVLLTV